MSGDSDKELSSSKNIALMTACSMILSRGDLSQQEWVQAIDELSVTGRFLEFVNENEIRFLPVICKNWKGEVIKDFTDVTREYRLKNGYAPSLI